MFPFHLETKTMEVEHPNAAPPTAADQEVLEKLKQVVEQALADGKVSRDEMARIKAVLYSNGKVTVQELGLVKKMVRELLGDAALEYDWS